MGTIYKTVDMDSTNGATERDHRQDAKVIEKVLAPYFEKSLGDLAVYH